MLETLCESRDPEYYNESYNYKQAVEVALNVKKEVLQGLTLDAMWEEQGESDGRAVSETSLVNRDQRARTAERQRTCAALAAREGEHETAASLLRLSLGHAALGEASAAAVEQAVAAVGGDGGGGAPAVVGSKLGDAAEATPQVQCARNASQEAGVERWRLEVVQLCVEEGCLAPWPPMLVHLLTSGSAATMRAGATLLVTQLRQDHAKSVGAEVLTYDLESEIWRAGRIVKVIDTAQEAKQEARSRARAPNLRSGSRVLAARRRARRRARPT